MKIETKLAPKGGYNLVSISDSASECVSVLLANSPEPLTLDKYNESAVETLKNVIAFHSTNWQNLKFDFDLPESQI